MKIKLFDYTSILGWSASRYNTFSDCKREYYYQYYGKFDREHSKQEVDRLKNLTSIPLETGSIVHDVIKAVLLRLRKSEADIDPAKFLDFVRRETEKQCRAKTFIEVYYNEIGAVSASDLLPKLDTCLQNFLNSKRYNWIKRTAVTTKNDWIVEPPGYGEARLDTLKVYCKVDFLFPVEDRIVIVDWKTGKQDREKHGKQLTGYTAWATYHLDRPADKTSSIIAYLYPDYQEIEIAPTDDDLRVFREKIQRETEEMYAFCKDVAENVPLDKNSFPMTENLGMCKFCNFREFCGG